MDFKCKASGSIPDVKEKLNQMVRRFESEHQDDIIAARNAANAAMSQMDVLAHETGKDPKDVVVDLSVSCVIALTTKEKSKWLAAFTPSR